ISNWRLLMSIINYASREIQFKIVYYGPALCGKTTNLGYIHQRINPQNRGDLVSLATAADRTLFFDFLPLNALVIKGFVTKFQLYTVPGQVIYNATRQLVLRSVDGIVFVADSQWEKMEENVESFKNLEDNLAKQNMSLDDVPYVLQYNKRDLPNIAPVNYLDYVLNNRKKRVQSFEVVSSTGQNVFATLNAVSQILLHKFSKQSDAGRSGAPESGRRGKHMSRPSRSEASHERHSRPYHRRRRNARWRARRLLKKGGGRINGRDRPRRQCHFAVRRHDSDGRHHHRCARGRILRCDA